MSERSARAQVAAAMIIVILFAAFREGWVSTLTQYARILTGRA